METSGFFFVIVTGIVVIALSYVLDCIWNAAVPVRIIYLAVRFPGVVLHECSHIAGCVLTGARIRNIVLFSREGGSVAYSRPALPVIGDVIISTAPLFLLPLVLSVITWGFSTWLGCVFPSFPAGLTARDIIPGLAGAVADTFYQNLVIRFSGWFPVYLYLNISIVLALAPSTQDAKNAAAGCLILALAAAVVLWSGIPAAVTLLSFLFRVFGYGLTLGLAYGLVALAASLPLLVWYLAAGRS